MLISQSIFILLLLTISINCDENEIENEFEYEFDDKLEYEIEDGTELELEEKSNDKEPIRIYQASPRILAYLEAEREFLKELEIYIKNTENNLKTLKNYVKKTLEIYDSKESNYQDVFSNPINSYLLMRRLTIDIDDIMKVQVNEPAEKLTEFVKTMRGSRTIPNSEDIQVAADGFVSLQVTYELETPGLRHGYLLSSAFRDIPPNRGEPLSYTDCRLLSAYSLNILSFEKYHEWKGQANMLGEDVEELGLPSPSTDAIVAEGEEKMKRFEEIGYDTDPPKVDPGKFSFCPMFGTPKVKKNYTTTLYSSTILEPQIIEQFQRLCRGERLRPISWDSQLRCSLFKGYDPYYRLQPIKLEEVSLDPLVIVLRDVITDREMETLINLGQDKLRPAFQVSKNGSEFISSARISSTSWLSTTSNKDTLIQSRKLEMITGFQTNDSEGNAEQYQVNNYGTSGLYKPHYDFYLHHLENTIKYKGQHTGNRIATVMYYLSDVPSGGATVFPLIGATIWPKKGDVVFWWNLKPNGELNEMTKHGGCPVLFGTKWVANRWILSHGQMFRKKCKMQSNAKFEHI